MIDPLNFDCNFRPAKSSDVSALHQLLHACWMETYGTQVSADSVKRFTDEDVVGEHLRLFIDTMQVAEVDGEIVGVINQFEEFITALSVAKAFRGNRIGFSLLHNAYIAGGRWLEVGAFNTSAMAFYEGCGWRKTDELVADVFGTRLAAFLMFRS
ncbi:GNAT family N-acetyltransferase [Rhizobium leguminosarum]|uniref:GNAT family N-acetyltransferase n=1 Tax=Rhizobium leguminosarum TaxID=384 RepID=UPI001C90F84E|nr:GNAT family N-acetyltransferase [Rhizobium leguminosarum]MBY2914151.1 GNAT family N-acetyltransferase [Rhizobium leguminosarum]MBY2969690.1 GNAT family N-acetyltransferase [Rhizobium leguminosarum]MBY2977063.1 GNAT family N-acetyltransferase [Rhizobium leguminosarum]MBY3005613.1 GNAT family N-acetyltransferase [Rhizobium leguminosarum]